MDNLIIELEDRSKGKIKNIEFTKDETGEHAIIDIQHCDMNAKMVVELGKFVCERLPEYPIVIKHSSAKNHFYIKLKKR